jgi:alpha-glucosidase
VETEWWKTAVIYQIYPRSFQDSNGDGIGDLNGIRRGLAYLSALGVDAIWISPFYPSPMADFGYDVADYCDVDPLFGTLPDCQRLIAKAHALGLKVILDFVPNHTSDQHPWFIESRSSRQSPKRDWYIWRNARPGGGPPNNWVSHFGGSAWEWDEASGQYYYHAYLKEQPDLNWRNPEVRSAMYDVLRFWLELGVDGFRVDVIWHLMKDAEFRDNLPNLDYRQGRPEIDRWLPIHSADQSQVHEVIEEMRAVIDAYPHRVLIGEIYLPLDRLMQYYGRDLKGAHLPFNFQLLQAPWKADAIARLVEDYEAALPDGAWPNWVLGNHDRPRIATRVGPEQAKVAAVLLLTLRGTPTLYYGDEIGVADVPIPPDQIRDPWALREPGIGAGRDAVRTPMQWGSFAPCRLLHDAALAAFGGQLDRAERCEPRPPAFLDSQSLQAAPGAPPKIRGVAHWPIRNPDLPWRCLRLCPKRRAGETHRAAQFRSRTANGLIGERACNGSALDSA